MQLKKVDLIDNNEFLKYCPRCDYAEFIANDSEKFTCLKCNYKICPNCNNDPPH